MDYKLKIDTDFDKNLFINRLYKVSGSESHTKIANDLGINKSNISKWENGTSTPKIKNLLKIAQYYNCSIDYLLGLTSDNEALNLTEIFKELLLYCSLNDMRKNVAQDYIEFHDKGDNCSITVQKDYYDLSATIHAYNSSRKLFDKMDNDQIIKYITETIYQNKID